jgi:hypothetical protein
MKSFFAVFINVVGFSPSQLKKEKAQLLEII